MVICCSRSCEISSSRKSQSSVTGILMFKYITAAISPPLVDLSHRASNASFPFWKICTSSHWAMGVRTFFIPKTVMGSSSTMNILFTIFIGSLLAFFFIEKYVESRSLVHLALYIDAPTHGLDLVFDQIQADPFGFLPLMEGLVHAEDFVPVAAKVQAQPIVAYTEADLVTLFFGLQDNPRASIGTAVFDGIGQEVQDDALQIGRDTVYL